MEMYLLKFSACLLVFWLIYVLLFERQKMHRFKRFYLLGTFIAALVIPILTITFYIEPIVNNFELESDFIIPLESSLNTIPQKEIPFWNLEAVLWLVYGLGALLFLTRFIVNLTKMYRRITKNETITQHAFIYVLLKECHIPHSFFNYLFFNKRTYHNNDIPKEVLLHEQTHAKELHSLDIIMAEMLQIVFWFHPLVYILKHHIKLNHEFLADQAVLGKGIDTKTYQNILLQFSSSTSSFQLGSAINYSSIKKRFTVMKTQTSKTRIWLSMVLLLPIIAILFYSFAEREYVQKYDPKIADPIKAELEKANDLQLVYTDGAPEALMKEYKDWIEKLNDKSSALFIPVGTFERLAAIYHLMNKAQRKSVGTYPSVLEHVFTQASFSDYRALTKTYSNAIQTYLKGSQTDNSELKILKAQADKIYNQFNEEELKKHNILPAPPVPAEKKTSYPKSKSKGGPNSEDHQDFYNPSFLEYIIEMEKEGASFYLDNQKISVAKAKSIAKNNNGKRTEMITQLNSQGKYVVKLKSTNNNQSQQHATKKQIAAYNAWAKKINTAMAKAKANNNVNEYPIVKVKEVNKYKAIYDIMTNVQKKAAQPWPNFPPPPPPPPPAQERATVIEIAAYDVWAKKMNAAIKKAESGNNKSYYPRIKKEDYDKYYNIYSNLMTEAQRETAEPWPNIPPPPPPSPEAPVLIEEQEIPNPPPPPVPDDASPEEIKRMKKVIENYEKKHPESVSKTKINGKVVEVVEIPIDQEGTTEIYGKSYKYVIKNGFTTYYDTNGKEYDEASFKEFIEGIEKNEKTPTSKPESTLDFVIRMAKGNAKFFYKLKPISSDEAIEIIKKKPKTNINAQNTKTKQPLIYLSDKPIHIGEKG